MKVFYRDRVRDNAGFTLVELLVAMAIVGILLAGLFTMLIRQQRSYEMQNQIVEVQQNLRSAMNFLRYDLRMIGHGLTEGTSPIADVSNNRPAANGTDRLSFNGNLDAATVVLPTGTQAEYPLEVGKSTTIPVSSVTGFSIAMPYGLDLVDPGTGTRVAAATLVEISDLNRTVTLVPLQSGTLWAGSYLGVPFQTISYEVDITQDTPVLVRDTGEGPEVVAEGVEDFQLAYGFDGINGHPLDGRVMEAGDAGDDDEWVYNVPGDTWPGDESGLRLIRVALLLRTVNAYPKLAGEQSGELEDHRWFSSKLGYRYRLIEFTENIRNLSF